MKTLIYPAIASLFIVVACKKEEFNTTAGAKPQNFNTYKQEGWGLNWKWDGNLEVCIAEPVNCFDEIVVLGNAPILDNFHAAIESGPSAIADFFNSSDGSDLFPGLYEPAFADQLNHLVSGNANIVIQTKGNTIHYLVYDNNNNLLFVLRIIRR